MKDFNFFEPYIQEEKIQKRKKIRPLIIVMIVLLFAGTAYVYRDTIINKATEAVTKENTKIEDERMEELKQKQLELAKLRSADRYLRETNRIDKQLLDDITTRLPDNVEYNSINIGKTSVQIKGNTKAARFVANYGDNLKELDDFEDIFTTSTTYDEEEKHYKFILDIDFKVVGESNQDHVQADG